MIFKGISDVGKRRSANQDCFDITDLGGGYTVLTVCDGMGGANGGNVASETAVKAFTDHLRGNFSADADLSALMKNAVAEANTAVYEKSKTDKALSGMGTTLVSAMISADGSVVAVNVGDSRMYRIDGDGMRQITKDHSYVQYLVDMGQITLKEAENASIKNIIIRSVGNEEKVTPDLFRFKLEKGDFVLLCSDGLTNCVKKDDIFGSVKAETEDELVGCAEELIKLANDGGGTDNITVILGKM